jgi:hypothetical protein
MESKRSKLAIAGDAGSVVSALAALWVIWPSVHARIAGLDGLITISGWSVYVWAAAMLLSLSANILFSIASRRQAKSVPIKVAHGFHSGKIDGGEAALFWHYSAYSSHLVRMLETTWHHWHDAGEVLSRPLDNDLPMKDQMGRHSREHDIFRTLYREHLDWLNWEIPEFSSDLPPIGSDVEYLILLNTLKTHVRLLDEAAKHICESRPVGLATRPHQTPQG